MLFNIDEDAGTRVIGWVMPDNPAQTPTVAVYNGEERLKDVPARIVRPLLREQGLHDTGLCGFSVDEGVLPGIAKMPRLEIYEANTLTLLYRRRFGVQTLERKVFRLETQLLPNARLNGLLDAHFQMSYPRLDALPHETLNTILALGFSGSIYASGRIYIAEYEPLLRERGYVVCTYLRDPVEELAEELLTLEWISRSPDAEVNQLENRSLVALAEAMKGKNLRAPDDFAAWILHLSQEQRRPLCDPTTRLLTCKNAEEQLTLVAVPGALDALATMAAVGLRDDQDQFLALVGAQLDRDFGTIEQRQTAPKVADLAAGLRDAPLVQQILAADLELYSAFTTAMKRVAEMAT